MVPGPMIAAFEPLTKMSSPLYPLLPKRVTPESRTSASPFTSIVPVKNALFEPEEARTTLFPVPLQLLSAAATRLVSSLLGGEERCEVLNLAVSVVQTAGTEGCDTFRLSPVASCGTPVAAACWLPRSPSLPGFPEQAPTDAPTTPTTPTMIFLFIA
jgi:hypothetical protein